MTYPISICSTLTDALTYAYTYRLWRSIWYGDFIDYGCCKSEYSRKAAWQNKYNNSCIWALYLCKELFALSLLPSDKTLFYIIHQNFKQIDTVALRLCEDMLQEYAVLVMWPWSKFVPKNFDKILPTKIRIPTSCIPVVCLS